jgi:hypothetical protein
MPLALTRSSLPLLAGLAAFLLLGCPPSEEEERRAAVLTFLSAEPSPSSLAVLQPGAADKLAAVEPDLTDETQRGRLVRALVLIDDDSSRAILVDVLDRDPGQTHIAFETAAQYQRLPSHLDLLYTGLGAQTREQVFIDSCWPAFGADEHGVLATCRRLWGEEDEATQQRWLRLFTLAGPHDDPAPYEALAEGLRGGLVEQHGELVLRISGGDVVPAEVGARDTLRFDALVAERRARREGSAAGDLTVAFDGGFVVVAPQDPASDSGRTGHRLLADLPMSCAATWGTGNLGDSVTLEVRLSGSKQRPGVRLVDLAGAAMDAPAVPASEEPPRDELLRACLEIGMADVHSVGSAPWVPRFGTSRITLRSHEGARWSELDAGSVVMTEADLRLLAEKLRESGTPAWRGRLALEGREELPLRDLGSVDLGFCMAFVAADWDDCARWLGEVSAVDGATQDVLRLGLRDADPDLRGLCRAALAVRMDDEALDDAARPPEPASEDEDTEPATAAGEGEGA